MAVFLVPEERMEDLASKFRKLNSKAAKTNCELATYTVGEKVVKYYDFRGCQVDITRAVHTKTWFEITVEGVAPKYDGWAFIGTLDYSEAGNVFRSVPGHEIPEHFRNSKPKCDHCKSKRSRKDTFVLRHESGTYIQVGRQCLRDFLGHQSPEDIVSRCTWLLKLKAWAEEDYRQPWVEPTPSVEYVIALTNAIVTERKGWVSRKAATQHNAQIDEYSAVPEKTPTTMYVYAAIYSFKDEKNHVEISQADYDKAAAIYAWVQEQKDTTEPFLKNLWHAFQNKTVKRSNIGLVAAAWKAYDRAHSEAVIREKKPESQHVGEVGKRQNFSNLKAVFIKEIEKEQFGNTIMIKFEDESGNCLVWFASSGAGMFQNTWSNEPEPFVIDQIYQIKATVKKHDEYQGKKQTVINRVVKL